MFDRKLTYAQVNREERFYCFLLGHALLASENFRRGFVDLIKRKLNILMDSNKLEIFVETAILRDYWHALGNPKTSNQKKIAGINFRRKEIVKKILLKNDLPERIINDFSLFWTKPECEGGKIRYPGRWPNEEIKAAGLYKKLQRIKWAFNVKPDIMIVSKSTVLFIEAKIESGPGTNSSGYNQKKVQPVLKRLLKILVPIYGSSTIKYIPLTLKKQKNGITWKEIIGLMEDDLELDEFTQKCMVKMLARYPK